MVISSHSPRLRYFFNGMVHVGSACVRICLHPRAHHHRHAALQRLQVQGLDTSKTGADFVKQLPGAIPPFDDVRALAGAVGGGLLRFLDVDGCGTPDIFGNQGRGKRPLRHMRAPPCLPRPPTLHERLRGRSPCGERATYLAAAQRDAITPPSAQKSKE